MWRNTEFSLSYIHNVNPSAFNLNLRCIKIPKKSFINVTEGFNIGCVGPIPPLKDILSWKIQQANLRWSSSSCKIGFELCI